MALDLGFGLRQQVVLVLVENLSVVRWLWALEGLQFVPVGDLLA